jgi:hypothetical protein
VIYLGNGLYSTTKEDYLMHYGRKGQKWGQHIYGEERKPGNGKRKRKKRSLEDRYYDRAEANRYNVDGKFTTNVNGKASTKKLPKSPIGMLFKYKDLSDDEYDAAMKGIRRRNEVYDGAINEAYRAERALNYPNVILKDVTTAMRNVDYLKDKFGENAAARAQAREAKLAEERKNIVNPSAGETLDFFEETGFKKPSISELRKMKKDLHDKDAMHSDTLKKGNYLEHYGVKGMKWGIRKDRNGKDRNLSRAQRKISKDAEKDAVEFARAKMFYGEGAGNRRKLIKATVNQKKKQNKFYEQEFEEYLKDQDMAEHAVKAKRERNFKDGTKKVKKAAKTAGNVATTISRFL